jgi:hypothetical protein
MLVPVVSPSVVPQKKELEFVQGIELQQLLNVLQVVTLQQARMARQMDS